MLSTLAFIFVHLFTDKPDVQLKISPQYEPVTYGNTILIEAQVQSLPPLTGIRWDKDKKVIHADNLKYFENKSDGQNPTLTIERVDFNDSGNYGITITNDLGSAEDHRSIQVGGSVFFQVLVLNIRYGIGILWLH